MRECNQKFSWKKLLLTLLCTVIVSVFIGTTILFASTLSDWIELEVLNNLDPESEIVIAIGNQYAQSWDEAEEIIEEAKETYGEDYPAEELFVITIIKAFSSQYIVNMYVLCFVIGIILGSIIYIIAVQNAKGKKLVMELIIAFFVIFAFILILNFIYEAVINSLIEKTIEQTASELASTEIQYFMQSYDINNNVFIFYLVALVVIYIINFIYQKIITYKLNK